MIPTPFRITGEDMGDAKTAQAVAPLIDALNVTLNDVVSILTGNVGADQLADEVKTLTLAIDTLEQAFPLVFATKVVSPKVVVLGNCTPKDPNHDLSVPFCLQGFSLKAQGQVSIDKITGLLAGNTYSLAFWIR